MTLLILLTLVLVGCSLNQAASDTAIYYITTNSNDLCTVPPCLTLSQFAANSSYYLHSNTTLAFLPGTHYLSKINLMLSNMDNFAMKSEDSTAQIKCARDSHIHFSLSWHIDIINLEFVGCGDNQVKHVKEFIVKDTMFEGRENSETALELFEVTAQIVNSTFVSNRIGSYRQCPVSVPWYDCLGDGFIGGAIIAINSTIDISQSKFEDNRADFGGALFVTNHSTINMSGNLSFMNNTANQAGGVIYSKNSSITINVSIFENNIADNGGVIFSINDTITIEANNFYSNCANFGGGVLDSTWSAVTIKASEFSKNAARLAGGVLYSAISSIAIGGSNFTDNSSPIGAVFCAFAGTKVQYYNYLVIDNNLADNYAVIYLSDSEFRGYKSGNVVFSNNLGSLMAFNSNVTFTAAYAIFVNNQPSHNAAGNIQEGGAITLFQSNIFFDGTCNFEHNHAENGGAIHSTESKLHVNGNVTIAHNTAAGNGGGIYLSTTSELNCQQKSTLVLSNNTAAQKGGGLHAISSSVTAVSALGYYSSDTEYGYIGTRINFTINSAKFGGGLSLEANAKLYILKFFQIPLPHHYENNVTSTAIFTANSAEYGGALYVDDDTDSGTCAKDPKMECFFQVLALYGKAMIHYFNTKCLLSMNFSKNYANISGSTLYGGLLDRCAVSQFAEFYKMYAPNEIGGIAYLRNVSVTTNISISSRPIRICLCTYWLHNHDCTYQNHINVRKGDAFKVSLVAVDQVGQPVNATIQTSLHFTGSGLAEGQLIRKIPAECTNLTFNVVSFNSSENLTLYASDGPCKDAELSTAKVIIHFLPCSCPIGLQISGTNNYTNCTCECHSDIGQYMKQCDSHTGSLVKQPQSRAWISYFNDTDLTGYLVYPNCPFDYCLSISPPVNLNQQNGADAQCAFNRSSLLCGSCCFESGLSLSLGSSSCLPCPSYWPAQLIVITIAAILAGIALIALLLVLNMTVAVGTLNGLIFYSNVVYTNRSILLPFKRINFVTVFISWLNLELGIDTCYFPGMDAYIKTWLQLAFPAYIMFLVVLIITISSYSTKFSNQIGKKNPVATLATLILLSYAKLLELCFKSLSLGVLEYPDGSRKMLWLPDAAIKYLSGKHIPLFIATILIFLVGLVYTILLFSWQCILHLPKWRIFNWSRNPKIQTFIETYNTPYTPKHRYWTGLLLIARVILLLIAAANVSNDPTIAVTAITFIVSCVVLTKGFIVGRLYKKWLLDILETFFFLNILFFTIFTWYSLGDKRFHQEAIAYTSVTITIIVLLLIILYHILDTYSNLLSKVKETKLGRMIDRLSTDTNPELNLRVCHLAPFAPDDDNHGSDRDRRLLDELDCPINTVDYATVPLISSVQTQPTYSVVEVHQPCYPAPRPPEGLNAQNMPADSDN